MFFCIKIKEQNIIIIYLKRYKICLTNTTNNGTIYNEVITMHYNNEKEVLELIKDIKDLNTQERNFNRQKLESVILSVKQKFFIESHAYESMSAVISGGVTTNIQNLTDDTLKGKIPYYKSLCVERLMEKCGKEFNKIVKENNLEV